MVEPHKSALLGPEAQLHVLANEKEVASGVKNHHLCYEINKAAIHATQSACL